MQDVLCDFVFSFLHEKKCLLPIAADSDDDDTDTEDDSSSSADDGDDDDSEDDDNSDNNTQKRNYFDAISKIFLSYYLYCGVEQEMIGLAFSGQRSKV